MVDDLVVMMMPMMMMMLEFIATSVSAARQVMPGHLDNANSNIEIMIMMVSVTPMMPMKMMVIKQMQKHCSERLAK